MLVRRRVARKSADGDEVDGIPDLLGGHLEVLGGFGDRDPIVVDEIGHE